MDGEEFYELCLSQQHSLKNLNCAREKYTALFLSCSALFAVSCFEVRFVSVLLCYYDYMLFLFISAYVTSFLGWSVHFDGLVSTMLVLEHLCESGQLLF